MRDMRGFLQHDDVRVVAICDVQETARKAAKAAKDSVPYMRKLWQDLEVSAQAEVEKAGVTVVKVDKAPFQAAVKPVYDQFITDPHLKDLLTRMQAVE